MKEYTVQVPIAGHIFVYVKANSKEDAINQAINDTAFSVEIKDENDQYLDYEIDIYSRIVSGNIFHATTNEAKVINEEEID